MDRRMFSMLATGLLVFPFGVNAASLKPEVDSFSQGNMQIAQNNFSRGKRGGKGGGMKKLLEQLDLTEEQSTQIDAIRDRFDEENEGLYQEMKAKKEEMRSLLASDASRTQLERQHQEMQTLQQQLSNNRFENMLQVREILTPEQRSQMAELIEEHRGKRGNR